MSDLFEEPPPAASNEPEFSVSEISGAVKRVIEGEFAHVRVRGEVGRVVVARTGHMYFDLKDDRATLAAVSWKGNVARLSVRPEEGMEVVATGRLTTFPGQSKYQMIVEEVAPAGVGALMAMLEKRRAALAAEGLFDAARKTPIPFLPGVIGVVTSPQGAVIRDILHRLRDRFPRRVLIWPVAVQGKDCAPQVAAAIRGFNALPEGGRVPRPDLLIVARGGGSIEDLWGFNEEIVVRAAADSRIPLISAVGHETDTTLIDHAADRRAPTPTAAAEMAVPVRRDLIAALEGQGARLARASARSAQERGAGLAALARLLPRPESLLAQPRQRLDLQGERLPRGLSALALRRRAEFERTGARVGPAILAAFLRGKGRDLAEPAAALSRGVAQRGQAAGQRAAVLDGRLAAALRRAGAGISAARERLGAAGARLDAAQSAGLARRGEHLAALERLRRTLGYRQTLARGYAIIRADGEVVSGRAAAAVAARLEIEFSDGRLEAVPLGPADPAPPGAGPAGPRPRRHATRQGEDGGGPGQGSLF